jgi:large subunit ribosomal protein L10
MANELKLRMGREIVERLRAFDSCVIVGLEKLSVDGSNRLRGKLAEENARLTVLHNRITRHALEEIGWGGLGELLRGSTAIAYGEDGAVPISRVLVEWEKSEKSIVLKGALIEGTVVGEDGVRKLATIPDRRTLMSQIMAGIQGPITGIVRCVASVMTGLATALQQIVEKKEKEQPASQS